jgi:hypothetical protein
MTTSNSIVSRSGSSCSWAITVAPFASISFPLLRMSRGWQAGMYLQKHNFANLINPRTVALCLR